MIRVASGKPGTPCARVARILAFMLLAFPLSSALANYAELRFAIRACFQLRMMAAQAS
jgi:hypothetical protein